MAQIAVNAVPIQTTGTDTMGIALTWGHTRLSETDFRLITQESPGFIHGECQSGLSQVRTPQRLSFTTGIR